jgi:hypothetical protein
LKWSFIEPAKIIVGNSVAHVKRSARVRRSVVQKTLEKNHAFGNKESPDAPMRIG